MSIPVHISLNCSVFDIGFIDKWLSEHLPIYLSINTPKIAICPDKKIVERDI